MNSLKKIEIFTDGACSGNPGIGGYAAILRYLDKEKEISGGERNTTNNRMEMMAVIKALEAVKEKCSITIYTDSQYVFKGANEWLNTWKNSGWKTSGKKNVKNIDLWQVLEQLILKHDISWKWVKGHAGHPENERVDTLARAEINKLR